MTPQPTNDKLQNFVWGFTDINYERANPISGAYVSLNSNTKRPSDALQPAEGGMVGIPNALRGGGTPGWPGTSHADAGLRPLRIYGTDLPPGDFRQNRSVRRKMLKTTTLHLTDNCNAFLDEVSLSSAAGGV